MQFPGRKESGFRNHFVNKEPPPKSETIGRGPPAPSFPDFCLRQEIQPQTTLPTGEEVDPGNQLTVPEGFPHSMQIDPQRARFPCCIVWTPLPVISWFIPFIDHIGICREDGVILDFTGPNFVCVDNFAFGAVACYVQINREQECWVSPHPPAFKDVDLHLQDDPGRETLTWVDAIRKSTQEFQNRSYILFTCNCDSFVAQQPQQDGLSFW